MTFSILYFPPISLTWVLKHVLRTLNPFILIKNKRLVISSEGFSALEKNAVRCSQRAMLPIQWGCDSPLLIIWQFDTYFLSLNLLGQVWEPNADNNGCLVCFIKKVSKTAITICSRLSHPTRSLSIIVCRGQEGPKGRKGTLRPDFQASNRPMIFKANVTTRHRK